METNQESTIFKVLMFPWLAHGHISPYLELSKKLIKNKNFQIFFCSTSINLNSINQENSNIEFIELHLPNMPDLPPHYHTTKGLPPNLLSTLILAFHNSKKNFQEIFNNLKPDLVIYDSFQPWAAEFASIHKVPSVHFYTSGAATMSYFYHMSKHGWSENGPKYPFDEIFIRDHDRKKLLEIVNSDPRLADTQDYPIKSFEFSQEIVLFKSSREVEGKYLDYLSELTGKEIVPLGPLVHQEDQEIHENHFEIFNWLDSKNPSSVVLVSFGSECYLSKKEMEEISIGLELSKVNFIWVIRFPAGTPAPAISEVVPEGFIERVQESGRGVILEGWAPQAKILGHKSIGGFMSHCGWSSIIESLYFGVPLISMAMKLDQPTNGRLMVAIGVGMEVLRDENGEWGRVEIARVIKEIVMKKESGENVKRKAKEFSEKLRMEEEVLVDDAIDKLRIICSTKKM